MTEEVKANEQFSFVKTEHEILKFWEENNTFQKSLEKTKNGKPYIFYDGPPFATGLPHHGHLVGSILKDVVPRYFTMKGRYVSRRFGWDCHGLPIEHEIDKKLGMSAQDAVKNLGVAGYNNECRSIVSRYTSEWKKTINRLGRWVDFDNGYKTMDANFMESVWWAFKQLWDKDLIYKGTKVVPFSTALGTVLSNFEASSNYQDVQDPTVAVLFKKLDEDNTYFVAWTTTPWTLPSNLGLCVGADIDYVKALDKETGKNIIMAKARLEAYKKKDLEVISEFKGSTLKGCKYEPLFPYFKDLEAEGAFRVLNDDYVSTDDGTGVVHIAPSFGEDDSRIFKQAGLAKLVACPVDDAGKFTAPVSDYEGVYVKEADKQIIRNLKETGKLFEQGTIVHSYPFCPRSDTPLIYRAIPSWYVKVEQFKDQIYENNKQINWVPDHIKYGRFGKWLEGARDWAISRNRVWGTPLPVWENDVTGKYICMGSFADIEKYTGQKLTDLHREFVDPLTFTIDGEEGVYRRIPEVLDCWFESGSMPYAQLHYPFENQELFKQGFPAEFIAEGLDQTRGWFYTLNILSTALHQAPAFKNVIVNGIVMAEDGKKMSKRLRNYTAPDVLLEEYGSDAFRLYLITSGLVKAEEQRFADNGVKDMVRRALLPWYNSFKFFQTYAEIDGWNIDKHSRHGNNIVDHWIISKLQTLKKNIAREMEAYHLYNVLPQLLTFIEDLTNWYIRLNRSRFWGEGLNDDKCAAYTTLYTTLKELSLAMAPFTPFLSEFMYQELGKMGHKEEESVHLCTYPVANEALIDKTLEDAVDRMQQIILLGRQKRNQVQIKVKTPLRRLTVIHKNEALLKEISKLETYIKTELNVKEVEYSTYEEEFITLFAKPNSPVLGKRLGKEFGKLMGMIKGLKSSDLSKYEEEGEITLGGHLLSGDDLLIFREPKPGTEALSNRIVSIDMDCKLDDELIAEGLAREVVNRIQRTRKDINLDVQDRITIEYHADGKLADVIEKYSEHIANETLCTNLKATELKENEGVAFDVDGFNLVIKIAKN